MLWLQFITVALGYTPFTFEPKIPIDLDNDGIPDSIGYSVEPSCLAPAKDDGQIGFNVIGGTQADGSQAPYQVIWENLMRHQEPSFYWMELLVHYL